MTKSNRAKSEPGDEIDLFEISQAIWSAKQYALIICLISFLGSICISLLLPNIYQSRIILAPSSDSSSGLSGSMKGQLGGIANLAGINIGESGNKVDVALVILKSHGFLKEFIKTHKLRTALVAAKSWDKDTHDWIIDQKLFNSTSNKWVKEFKTSLDWIAIKKLKDSIKIEQDNQSALITVKLESMSPQKSKEWLEALILELNNTLSKKEIADANHNISYIREQLNKTKISEIRNVLFNLLEAETKRLMLAQDNENFALRILDEPYIPEEKLKPKRTLIVLGFTLFGLAIGTLLSFVVGSRKQD